MFLDRKGIAALEFALLAPLLAAISVGLVETVLLVRADMLLNFVTTETAQIIGSKVGPVLHKSEIVDTCFGARLTMRSYDTSSLSMAIMSATNDVTKGQIKVWEVDNACPTAYPALGTPPQLAKDLMPKAGDNVIYVEASYVYPAMFPQITGTITLSHNAPYQLIHFPSTGSSNGTLSCDNC